MKVLKNVKSLVLAVAMFSCSVEALLASRSVDVKVIVDKQSVGTGAAFSMFHPTSGELFVGYVDSGYEAYKLEGNSLRRVMGRANFSEMRGFFSDGNLLYAYQKGGANGGYKSIRSIAGNYNITSATSVINFWARSLQSSTSSKVYKANNGQSLYFYASEGNGLGLPILRITGDLGKFFNSGEWYGPNGGAWGIDYDQTQKKLYVTAIDNGKQTVIRSDVDVNDSLYNKPWRTLKNDFQNGARLKGVAVDEKNQLLFVADAGRQKIYIFNIKDGASEYLKEIDTAVPDGISISGNRLVSTSYENGGLVSIFEIGDGTEQRRLQEEQKKREEIEKQQREAAALEAQKKIDAAKQLAAETEAKRKAAQDELDKKKKELDDAQKKARDLEDVAKNAKSESEKKEAQAQAEKARADTAEKARAAAQALAEASKKNEEAAKQNAEKAKADKEFANIELDKKKAELLETQRKTAEMQKALNDAKDEASKREAQKKLDDAKDEELKKQKEISDQKVKELSSVKGQALARKEMAKSEIEKLEKEIVEERSRNNDSSDPQYQALGHSIAEKSYHVAKLWVELRDAECDELKADDDSAEEQCRRIMNTLLPLQERNKSSDEAKEGGFTKEKIDAFSKEYDEIRDKNKALKEKLKVAEENVRLANLALARVKPDTLGLEVKCLDDFLKQVEENAKKGDGAQKNPSPDRIALLKRIRDSLYRSFKRAEAEMNLKIKADLEASKIMAGMDVQIKQEKIDSLMEELKALEEDLKNPKEGMSKEQIEGKIAKIKEILGIEQDLLNKLKQKENEASKQQLPPSVAKSNIVNDDTDIDDVKEFIDESEKNRRAVEKILIKNNDPMFFE